MSRASGEFGKKVMARFPPARRFQDVRVLRSRGSAVRPRKRDSRGGAPREGHGPAASCPRRPPGRLRAAPPSRTMGQEETPMITVTPSGAALGARLDGVDLNRLDD